MKEDLKYIFFPPPRDLFLRDIRQRSIAAEGWDVSLVPMTTSPKHIDTVLGWESDRDLMQTFHKPGEMEENGLSALRSYVAAYNDAKKVMFGMEYHGYVFGMVGLGEISEKKKSGSLFVLNGERQLQGKKFAQQSLYLLFFIANQYGFTHLTADVVSDNAPSIAVFSKFAKGKKNGGIYRYSIDPHEIQYPLGFAPVIR